MSPQRRNGVAEPVSRPDMMMNIRDNFGVYAQIAARPRVSLTNLPNTSRTCSVDEH